MANAGTKLWLGNREALSGDYHVICPPISPALETQVGGLRQPCTQAYVVSPPLTASMSKGVGNGGKDESVVLAFDPTQVTSAANRSSCRGDVSPMLAKGARSPHIAFNARQDPISGPISGPIDTDSSTWAVCATGETTHALRSVGADASEDGTGRGTPIVTQPAQRVRRLTPRECERLQGFPDDWTAIPGAADGPRYAALGNSMAVPVMRWIGQRIFMVDEILKGLE